MKNLSVLVVLLFSFGLFYMGCQDVNQPEDLASQGSLDKKVKCASITAGTVFYSATHYLAGDPIPTGFDAYGYNYQAHEFKGSYFNVYAGGVGFAPWMGEDVQYLIDNPGAAAHWAWPYRMYEIAMKWNDAWLSNQDCNSDGKLDRASDPPVGTYIDSGAWEMYSEKMGGPDGYTYKCKIVAVPADATLSGGYWYNADGVEIGWEIWGEFAVIQEVQGGSGVGDHGLLYKGKDHAGFGGW